MKKGTKVWLITAASLVFAGCMLFVGIMTAFGGDFMKLSTVKYETNTYELSEEFDGVYINADTADIALTLSDDEKCRVVCYEEENAKHLVAVEDGVLAVKLSDNRSVWDFFRHIGLNFDSPKITIYLPETEYASLVIDENTGDVEIPQNFTFKDADISLSTGDVAFGASVCETAKIQTSTGDICVDSAVSGSLELTVSTGKVKVSGVKCDGDVFLNVTTGKGYLNNIVCKSLVSSGSTGDIVLNNVIAKEKLSVNRSTGDVKFNGCDAAEIYVKTDTGDITGSLLSEKVFITNVSTGKVKVPNTISGGRCQITTNTGNVEISVLQK